MKGEFKQDWHELVSNDAPNDLIIPVESQPGRKLLPCRDKIKAIFGED